MPSRHPIGSTQKDGPSVGKYVDDRSLGKPEEMATRKEAESDGAVAAVWVSRVGGRISQSGVPRWLSGLGVQLLIPSQVMVSGS